MEHVSLLQSHFSYLSHDHLQRSCIGGPVRLVQSRFTCHSHERSSCFFFVLVYPTYTCVRLLHDTLVNSHGRFLLHALFHASRSSVSVVLQFLFSLPRVSVEMFCLAQKHFISLTQVARVSRLRVRTTICLSFPTHAPIISRPLCRHISSLVVFCSFAARARTPRFHLLVMLRSCTNTILCTVVLHCNHIDNSNTPHQCGEIFSKTTERSK